MQVMWWLLKDTFYIETTFTIFETRFVFELFTMALPTWNVLLSYKYFNGFAESHETTADGNLISY